MELNPLNLYWDASTVLTPIFRRKRKIHNSLNREELAKALSLMQSLSISNTIQW